MSKLQVAVIGLGKQGSKYLQAIANSGQVELVAVCDVNNAAVNKAIRDYHCEGYTKLDDLLQSHKLDLAIVAVPHNIYIDIIKTLAEHGVHILKEKPFATSIEETYTLKHLVESNNVHMMISTQRRFDTDYQQILQLLPSLGKLSQIEGKYTFERKPREGWRYLEESSLGGVLLDMGYHIIDLLLWYWGMPQNINAKLTGINANMEDQSLILFNYSNGKSNNNDNSDKKIVGSLMISRDYVKKQEKLKIIGENGYINITQDVIKLFDVNNKLISSRQRNTKDEELLKRQVEHFVDFLNGNSAELINNYKNHFQHMLVINNVLEERRSANILATKENKTGDFQWPIITDKTKAAVIRQLDQSISIYDRSGVVKEFEDKFANYHGKKYALLSNSGTSAIYAMFGSLELGPGDEVLAPVYTFPATVSPLALGDAKLVFCDCKEDGNIDPAEIEKKITPKTKALIITHMWGIPCDMDEIVNICKKHNLKLLEDCSHAHGARYKGKLVGTFGDISAWSLQGQKIVPAGQGGILLTDDKKIYDRALLHNEFNRRCWNEISKSDELYKYTSTGFGLNHKPHPLGVAVANAQFDELENRLYYKRLYASRIINELSKIPFLKMPQFENKDPSWYAFIMQFDPKIAGCTIQEFYQSLKAAGLNDVDLPASTRPLNKLALFNEPNDAISKNERFKFFTSAKSKEQEFTHAEHFYQSAIKIPVWVRAEDKSMVDKYINTIKQVAMDLNIQQKIPVSTAEQSL